MEVQSINLLPCFRSCLLCFADLQNGVAVQTPQLAQAAVQEFLLLSQLALKI